MNDAIRHELQVVVGSLSAAFGGEEHRRALFDQKAQEGECLPAELEGIGGQVAELGHGIQKDALRFKGLDLRDNLMGSWLSLHLGRGEDIVAFDFGEEG